MSSAVDRIIEESDAPGDLPTETLDVRTLGPPKPLSETLERLTEIDERLLVQLNDRAPQHLYPRLDDRGYAYTTVETDDATVTLIWEADMSTAENDEDSGTDEERHDTSWSVNLETPAYADSPDRAIRDGIDAIERTASGQHVNLVTHADLGHPSGFLFEALEDYEGPIEFEYVDQCGCGGYVTRVHVG